MIWQLIILSSSWLGYEIVNLLAPNSWDVFTIVSGGVPIGITITSWIFYFLKDIFSLGRTLGAVVTLVSFCVSYVIHLANKRAYRFKGLKKTEMILFGYLFIMFLRLVSDGFLSEGRVSSGTIFSDLPFHMSIINSFAIGGNRNKKIPETPFYSGERLSYPIIPDFYSSVLMACGGASLRVSITVPTMILLAGLLFAIRRLAMQFSRDNYIVELSVVFFIFASGTGWRYYFYEDARRNPNVNLVHCFFHDTFTFWIHSLIHFLLPQRSALFSMIPAILCISIFNCIAKNPSKEIKSALLAGIFMGALPMISAHSYIGIGEYALFICALTFPYFDFKKWKETIIAWCCFGIPAILLSLPQIIYLNPKNRKNFFSIEAIHKETDNSIFGFFTVWWGSLGAFVLIAIVFVYLTNTPQQNQMYLPSIGVWIVSNLIRYQPGAMDNTKVFYAGWYTLACCTVAQFFISVWTKSRNVIIKVFLVLIFIGFSFSSFICIYKSIAYPFTMFGHDDMNFGKWVIRYTDPNSVFLSSAFHSNPAMSYGGRLVTMGYGGWIGSHGLDYGKRDNFIKHLVSNDLENVTSFESNGIKYIFSRDDDKERGFQFPEPAPNSHWVKIFEFSPLKVYRLLKKV